MLAKIRGLKFNGISDDSRNVKKGDIFFAIEGARFDGRKFIDEAVKKGAAVIVAGKEFKEKINGVKIIRVSSPRIELARFAHDFYGRPSSKLKVIGITGTNGKTTISYLLAKILKTAGYQTGVIGTIAHNWKEKAIEAKNTTPGAIELERLLSMMSKDGVSYCAMEVSSHSLDQDRVFGIDFDSAIFTNITGEHLDYHKTFKNYLAAKAKLFRMLKPKKLAILNFDDKNFKNIKKGITAKILTYGIRAGADVRAQNVNISLGKTEFLVKTKKGAFLVESPLAGIFNVYNILAAVCYALSEGVPIEFIKETIKDFYGAEGRLEAVGSKEAFRVFIDYAHTDDALKNVLSALRPLTRNKLIVVFGCGGDRDKFKRPRMGNVASNLADRIFITSDNPRSEDPEIIAGEIEAGLEKKFKDYKIILNRFNAIKEAVTAARPGDIVLIAGKGHEKYQIIKDKILPFSDREAVKKCLV